MNTQRLENPYNALWESRDEWIPASRQKMAPAAESSINFILEALIHSLIQRNTTKVNKIL